MLWRFLSTCILCLSFCIAAPHPSSQYEPGLVNTTSGAFRPLLDSAYPDVYQYLGIPFARPPTGQLRFSAPRPADRNSQIVNANQISSGCYQVPPSENIFDVYEPGFGFRGQQSEDCLKLDVYCPATMPKQSLPVLVFVYGGGFIIGGNNETYEIPTPWVQAKQNLIIVNIQYRLNIFGFPNSAALDQNNLGLQDIRASVQWVQQNAQAFGGDPNRITLWGQSAGSISVNAWTYSYLDDPIVTGTISTSGVALAPRTGWQSMDDTQSNFTFVAEQLGCAGNTSSQLECMRQQPVENITNFLAQYNGTGRLAFRPVVDNKLVFANYTERLLSGQVTREPAILGTNRREGERSLDKGLSPNGPNQTLALAYTVAAFLCPAQLTAKLRHRAGVNTYRYEYKGNFSNISPLPWMGAYHASPLPLLFGTTDIQSAHPYSGNSTPHELAVGSHMQDLWYTFSQNPYSLANSSWPLNGGGAVNETSDAVLLLPGHGEALSSIEYGARREEYCSEIDAYLISEGVPASLASELEDDGVM